MEKLNFNQLAWEAPQHGDKNGYLPTDKYYQEICEWLKTGSEKYKIKQNGEIIVRKSFENSQYDVIVTFVVETKMINWVFIKSNEYEV